MEYDLNKKIAEYTYAVVKDKPHFHISLVIDVSPYCDCHAENDVAVIPDIGMFASFDPVALDVARADACNKQPMFTDSFLGAKADGCSCEQDHFKTMHPNTNWKVCVEHAEKLGVGTTDYELVVIK